MEENLRKQMHQKEKEAMEDAYAAARKGDIYSAYEHCDLAIKARAASTGYSAFPEMISMAEFFIIKIERHWDKLSKIACEAANSSPEIREVYEKSLTKLKNLD